MLCNEGEEEKILDLEVGWWKKRRRGDTRRAEWEREREREREREMERIAMGEKW